MYARPAWTPRSPWSWSGRPIRTREQPVTARIVRAVNAYEEMAREAGPGGPLTALEKLRLATARDYQPEVVESLARVLLRGTLYPCPGWVTHG